GNRRFPSSLPSDRRTLSHLDYPASAVESPASDPASSTAPCRFHTPANFLTGPSSDSYSRSPAPRHSQRDSPGPPHPHNPLSDGSNANANCAQRYAPAADSRQRYGHRQTPSLKAVRKLPSHSTSLRKHEASKHPR